MTKLQMDKQWYEDRSTIEDGCEVSAGPYDSSNGVVPQLVVAPDTRG